MILNFNNRNILIIFFICRRFCKNKKRSKCNYFNKMFLNLFKIYYVSLFFFYFGFFNIFVMDCNEFMKNSVLNYFFVGIEEFFFYLDIFK